MRWYEFLVEHSMRVHQTSELKLWTDMCLFSGLLSAFFVAALAVGTRTRVEDLRDPTIEREHAIWAAARLYFLLVVASAGFIVQLAAEYDQAVVDLTAELEAPARAQVFDEYSFYEFQQNCGFYEPHCEFEDYRDNVAHRVHLQTRQRVLRILAGTEPQPIAPMNELPLTPFSQRIITRPSMNDMPPHPPTSRWNSLHPRPGDQELMEEP